MSDFYSMGLNEPIISAIKKLGFKNPTEVQIKSIPLLIDKPKDIVSLAQTGTGKTAAFGLPILHHIDIKSKHTQALIIAPTRELCLQITSELEKYAQPNFLDELENGPPVPNEEKLGQGESKFI